MFRFDHLFPYAIPPALTLLVCLFLASLTIRAGAVKRENQLFTLLCLAQAIYNLDLVSRTLLVSSSTMLTLIRLDHLSFVFSNS